jgi:hypothetical protein
VEVDAEQSGSKPSVLPVVVEVMHAAWVLLALPLGAVLLAPPVLTRLVGVLLRGLRRAPLERPLSGRGVGAAVGWALVMWGAYGVHL